MTNKTRWMSIDDSPILKLPSPERKALREAGDPAFRNFWAKCFSAVVPHVGSDETLPQDAVDGSTFCTAFLRSFDLWEPSTDQSFSAYLRTSIQHEHFHTVQQDDPATNGFGRETNRKIRKALAYMESIGVTVGNVCSDTQKLQLVASTAGVSPKTLHEALLQQQALLRLDAVDQTGSPFGETIADTTAPSTDCLENTEPLDWLHQGIALMSLAEKEQYGKHAGPLWSSVILSFLRGSIERPLDEPLISERLANCDDLRSLEADNCLWDILLLRSYVAFCLHPPYTPDELEHAALNPVMDENFPPQQDKTVAKFLGVSKAAISQRRKTWSRSILNMKNAQEEP